MLHHKSAHPGRSRTAALIPYAAIADAFDADPTAVRAEQTICCQHTPAPHKQRRAARGRTRSAAHRVPDDPRAGARLDEACERGVGRGPLEHPELVHALLRA